MKRAGRIVLLAALAALAALLPATSAGGQSRDLREAAVNPYWLGPYFAGLRITRDDYQRGAEFVYGDCKLPEGEGGCSWPAEVRTSTSCARNPIANHEIPSRVFLLRGGGLAMRYDELAQVDIDTGDRTVTIHTREPELMGAALREVRRRSQPVPEELAPPVYPTTVLRELKRVTAAAERLHGVKAIATETELTPDQVRFRLRVAELLGPDALDGVPVPTLSTKRIQRLIELAVLLRLYPKRVAEKNGKTVAQLRRMVRPVRGLTGFC